jgi:hypothetical protein
MDLRNPRLQTARGVIGRCYPWGSPALQHFDRQLAEAVVKVRQLVRVRTCD